MSYTFNLRFQTDQAILQMVKMCVVKRAASPFASPMTLTSVRRCLNVRWINKQTIFDHEAAPRPPKYVYSIVYVCLANTVLNLPLFCTMGSAIRIKFLPFEFKSAVGSFSRAMNIVLGQK